MLTIRQLFFSLFLLGLILLKSQAVGSSTYLELRYGEGEYPVCPVDDGWNSYWAKLEMAQGSLSYEEYISGDPYYEFDELCPKDTFTTCGCLYREFAKTLMTKLNERSMRMFGKEAFPSGNAGYENFRLYPGKTVKALFTDTGEYTSLLTEIEDELNIYFVKDICENPKDDELKKACAKVEPLGANLIEHARLMQIGTYLFAYQHYEKTALSFGGSIPSASTLELGHDFARAERKCLGNFPEEQKPVKFDAMNAFLWENDIPEKNGSVFCPFVNGRRTLLSHNPAVEMIARELCPSQFQELN